MLETWGTMCPPKIWQTCRNALVFFLFCFFKKIFIQLNSRHFPPKMYFESKERRWDSGFSKVNRFHSAKTQNDVRGIFLEKLGKGNNAQCENGFTSVWRDYRSSFHLQVRRFMLSFFFSIHCCFKKKKKKKGQFSLICFYPFLLLVSAKHAAEALQDELRLKWTGSLCV